MPKLAILVSSILCVIAAAIPAPAQPDSTKQTVPLNLGWEFRQLTDTPV